MAQGGPVAGGVSLGAKGRISGDQDRRAVPMPLRPRGGFGAYLNDLRGLRGMTIRGLAAAAGLHHTYISKLERGDRQAPDPKVVEALATALRVSPSQLDQLRWRAGLGGNAPATGPETAVDAVAEPREVSGDGDRLTTGGDQGPSGTTQSAFNASEAIGLHVTSPGRPHATAGRAVDPLRDPVLTLVADALDTADAPGVREALRRSIAHAVQAVLAPPPMPSPWIAPGTPSVHWPVPASRSSGRPSGADALPLPAAPGAVAGPEVVSVNRFAGGIVTLEAGASEIHVTPDYLWQLVQAGHLAAWVLPGTPVGSPVGVRLRREDVLALMSPLAFGPTR